MLISLLLSAIKKEFCYTNVGSSHITALFATGVNDWIPISTSGRNGRSLSRTHLVDEAESRMVVAQILLFSLGEVIAVIPPSLFTLLVLPHKPHQKGRKREGGQPLESYRGAKACGIGRSLVGEVNVAGDDAAKVPESDLHGCPDTSLVVATEIVLQPYEDEGLVYESTHDD